MIRQPHFAIGIEHVIERVAVRGVEGFADRVFCFAARERRGGFGGEQVPAHGLVEIKISETRRVTVASGEKRQPI